MIRNLKAPLALIMLAISLSGCIFVHHRDGGGYYGGGGGYDHGPGGGYYQH